MSTHALVARVELPLQRSGQPGVLRSCSRERGAAPSSSWTSRAIFLARFPEIPRAGVCGSNGRFSWQSSMLTQPDAAVPLTIAPGSGS